MNWSADYIGDGISWPVVEGCDQYTLTVCTIFFVLFWFAPAPNVCVYLGREIFFLLFYVGVISCILLFFIHLFFRLSS